MRILLAGADNPLAKAFVKENKKKHELIALDESASDFSDYLPIREIFQAYQFDAVLYFTAVGGFGKAAVCSGNATLLKNLAYAAALGGIGLLVIADAEENAFFNQLVAGIAGRDKTVTLLRIYGLIGKGLGIKVNPIMKLLSDANKLGKVELAADRTISLAHTDDALRAVTGLFERGLEGGCIDLCPQKPTSFIGIARAAKRILSGEVEVQVLHKTPFADYVGDPERLKNALPKLKLTAQNTSIERVLGNV